jgi:hypothetical protein
MSANQKINYMKILLSLFFVVSFMGCVKEKTPETPLDEMLPAQSSGKLYSGDFVNGPYGRVSGKAHIVKDSSGVLKLQLEGLMSSNGPDLKVYLSKEIQPVNFINLGVLKSVNGTQLYDISGMPDFMEYKYALIHCQAYNHLFGSALLIKN